MKRGELRKLGSRLYSKNLEDDPKAIVTRNWYYLVPAYYHDALIADRTAIENRPADDGSIFVISEKTREIALPGITLRPRKGPAPLSSDATFIGDAKLTSTQRAWFENMSPSRARGGKTPRTFTSEEREARLDAILRHQGEQALNHLRDEARAIAPQLGLEDELQ